MLLPKNTQSKNGNYYTVSTKDEYRWRKFDSIEARKAYSKSLREIHRDVGVKDYYSAKRKADEHCVRLNARLGYDRYEVHECGLL